MTQLATARMSARSFYALCKPRVTALIVFTAMIGMFMATPGMVPLQTLLVATVGIAFASGAAAAFNCLIEYKIDAMMARTRARPLPTGQLSQMETLLFASVLGGLGLSMLYYWVNPLTMWLTLGTFVGYAVIYTVFLKPATPMNIVIGGASGAMPPILGWAAVNNTVSPEALVMFLIIFAWTPPHFWALALYRREEYAKVGMPMLPVTHGEQFTLLHIVLYTIILVVVSMMPFGLGMSGWLYLAAAAILNCVFMYYVVSLYRHYSDALAKTTFKYSILYLSLIFAALLLDHYLV
ncbi:protoheme IX farnesyltransferase [Methylophilus medardicus]|uniref:Protoheme IX farnesyltransferase n=1 Tax=Methylophilus medardicus TaxID=2588534 RepID=A0A5B8CVU7_9PROT|nr:protoheme IX farnesyltransferase [Methylophilus medardicus]QDC50425.1 protoheme IX farnesyltransferase [Methylophilus medardicus]QDC54130.1 protoheme IX farnesyltransferase [Methylophilus medardicus]